MQKSAAEFVSENLDFFCCPKCKKDIRVDANTLYCDSCSASYPVEDGIPMLFSPNEWDDSKSDVTEKMKSFYEENPFPDYDDFDDVGSLIEKARRGIFAKLLDDQVPFGARILECGCGTGQLTNFLSVANRTVVGTDMCMNSLRMAHAFKKKQGLDGAHFLQMNLFRPCFRPQSFDLVISNGVLHHTSDPFGGFESISTLVKPGGHILVGLYHRYGRLVTDIRRVVFNTTKDRFKWLDARNVDPGSSSGKRNAWFMDQYKNPHESKHTVAEVLKWLDTIGFTFVTSIPKTVPFAGLDPSENLFEAEEVGSRFEQLVVNMGMVFTGSKEGGFFIVIGKKADVA